MKKNLNIFKNKRIIKGAKHKTSKKMFVFFNYIQRKSGLTHDIKHKNIVFSFISTTKFLKRTLIPNYINISIYKSKIKYFHVMAPKTFSTDADQSRQNQLPCLSVLFVPIVQHSSERAYSWLMLIFTKRSSNRGYRD